MKIWVAQINTKVGDLEYNEKKITQTIRDIWKDSDVIVFPEGATTGYPIRDLVESDEFVKEQKDMLYRIRNVVQETSEDLKVILWFVDYKEWETNAQWGMKKFNSAAIIGRDIETYNKQLLPNYDVFDEKRHFSEWTEDLIFKFGDNLTWALTICEDMRDTNYENKPLDAYKDKWVDMVFNVSASPFSVWKLKERQKMIKNHVRELDAWFVYLNQVWWQDDIVFDGWSMICNKEWKFVDFANTFEEDIKVVDTEAQTRDKTFDIFHENDDKNKSMLNAMRVGLKDYLTKTGIKKVVIGISGGIDSALSAYVLSEILAPEDIHAIYMPTKHNENESLEISQKLCDNLWIKLEIWEINDLVESFANFSENTLGESLWWLTYENIQARIRWDILMMMANNVNWMVINNSNKTELALWYGTIYGDLIGWYSVLGDLNKKEVYEMASFINKTKREELIPTRAIDRKATAELNDNQVDPFDYDRISEPVDDLLFWASDKYIKETYNLTDNEIDKFRRLIKNNEFKRQQSPMAVKLKNRAIGSGRSYPVAQWYKSRKVSAKTIELDLNKKESAQNTSNLKLA